MTKTEKFKWFRKGFMDAMRGMICSPSSSLDIKKLKEMDRKEFEEFLESEHNQKAIQYFFRFY